ncbi:16S rRNA (cytosine(1402)-N(4))-methyltransferase RsmH [Rhodohalobacter sp. SW132]|nr:16S rRNA (cytosine(1402)-N(4))-methyltransferase RsmH [Rhodohalobacter sp. SW132]
MPHTPVLLKESVDYLVTDPDGIYIDATLGGGGHTAEILSRLSGKGRLFGLDQDAEAHKAAADRIGSDERFTPVSGNFGYLKTLIPPEHHGKITGILYDLGVSTHQIKEAERGFSFQNEGPLDMRMSELTGTSAHQVVNEYSYEKLRDIIFHYGEERFSREIAKEIISRRPLETTAELKDAVSSVVFGKHKVKSIARVFQGIRIEVNRELDVLKDTLNQAIELLAEDGRIVAISYHSLEDRIVKNFFKSGNESGKVEKDFYGNPLNPLKPLTRNIITPSDQEIKANPASRSAKLRVAEKIGGDQ